MLQTHQRKPKNTRVSGLHTAPLVEGKQRIPLKLAASKTDLCVYKNLSISIVRTKEATSLTSPFVILIVLMKPKIPKISFFLSYGLRLANAFILIL
uniref:Uncharacterized protein n=1 Tax=Anguilla anguilla TaxID=7936 RepID=A0A0E9X390_ANGAN